MDTFWVVWQENGGVPTRKHATPRDASNEAERLARKCPGERFFVLCSIASCVKVDVSWDGPKPDQDDDVPF